MSNGSSATKWILGCLGAAVLCLVICGGVAYWFISRGIQAAREGMIEFAEEMERQEQLVQQASDWDLPADWTAPPEDAEDDALLPPQAGEWERMFQSTETEIPIVNIQREARTGVYASEGQSLDVYVCRVPEDEKDAVFEQAQLMTNSWMSSDDGTTRKSFYQTWDGTAAGWMVWNGGWLFVVQSDDLDAPLAEFMSAYFREIDAGPAPDEPSPDAAPEEAAEVGQAAMGGSLFRLLPQPGRWCRYRTVWLATVEGSADAMPEQRGQVTVSALDVVEHDGAPHQWIEISNTLEVPTAGADEPPVTEEVIYKCLVRRDQLQAGGDPLGHIARGWLKTPGAQPAESDPRSFTVEGPEALLVRLVMNGPLADTKPVSIPSSTTIDGEKLESATGMTGTLEPTSIGEQLEIDGEVSYWTHDSAGFGVLASELLLNARRAVDPNTTLTMQVAVQMELEEQGDGAVSTLADYE